MMTVMRNILSKYHIDEDDVGAGCLNTRSVEGPSCKWPLCLLPSGRHSQSTLRFASNLAPHFLIEQSHDGDNDGDKDDDDDDVDQAVTLNPCYASNLIRHFLVEHTFDGDNAGDNDVDDDDDSRAVTFNPCYDSHRHDEGRQFKFQSLSS